MSTALAIPGQISDTALELAPGLPFEEWHRCGCLLGQIGRSMQWWIGDWVNYGEATYGEKYAQALDATGLEYQTVANMAWVAAQYEFSLRKENLSWSHHHFVAALPPDERETWLDTAEAEEWSAHELRRAVKESKALPPPPAPSGTYSTIVIDPPWPIEKIEREVRPNQAKPLDYRTMEVEEIASLDWCGGSLPAADGCHVYLWVTQKFLPVGLDLLCKWGVEYQCTLTWVKNVGFTPYSWMYSTEHVLFGRIGSLDVVEKGLRLDFNGKVREHSCKPNEFYELVCKASPGPRIDMFGREPREGFTIWGDEAVSE
jgi:N6-adenosine-specific RNA methylase IME4